jgi:hypothetical protein
MDSSKFVWISAAVCGRVEGTVVNSDGMPTISFLMLPADRIQHSTNEQSRMRRGHLRSSKPVPNTMKKGRY